jgi:hypothetical protein
MPTEESCRLYDHQSPSPVEETAEPHERHPRGIIGASRFGLALLILRQLFAQKEIFRCQGRRRSQTQHEKMSGIEQKCQQGTSHLTKVVNEGMQAHHDDLNSLR